MQPEPALDREDVMTMMGALFDIRSCVVDLHELFFEDDEGQEEEEPADP
jgi:hypothetical protein